MSVLHLGQEYPAIVEFAPFQKVSKKKLKKKDAKAGSIEEGISILLLNVFGFKNLNVICSDPKVCFPARSRIQTISGELLL